MVGQNSKLRQATTQTVHWITRRPNQRANEPLVMNPSKTLFLILPKLCLIIASTCFVVGRAAAASYEWTFDSGNLLTSLGNGSMAYADAQSGTLTSFGTTGGGVPNIGGNVANYMYVPAFANPANGYHLTFNNTAPNGGGAYVNDYTVLFDVLVPGPWPIDYIVPFFNTDPANGNDADFYLYGDGEIGIGSGYSAPNTMLPNTWYRVGFVASASTLSYYVNGSLVASRAGGGVDGRWSLFSNLDAGPDLLLFNEGDLSGQYTHELYLNSVAFVDEAMSGGQLLALGGPNAISILPVPEPTAINLALLGFWFAGAMRTRTKSIPS